MSVVWGLHRDEFTPAKDTVRGVLSGMGSGPHLKVFQTVERLSTLIPDGEYLCRLDWWYRGDKPDVRTYEIIWPHDEDGDGQPDRDRLLFHYANAVRNRHGRWILRGCVAPGLVRAQFWGNATTPEAENLPGVGGSGRAHKAFMIANSGLREFMLKVTSNAS